MEKLNNREAQVAFLGVDLSAMKKYLEALRSSWNGEDAQFSHEGQLFHEDDVSNAEEIIEKIDELQEMLNNFVD